MDKRMGVGILVATCLAVVGCVAAKESHKGYVICNDLAANTTCPDNTANVVVGM